MIKPPGESIIGPVICSIVGHKYKKTTYIDNALDVCICTRCGKIRYKPINKEVYKKF